MKKISFLFITLALYACNNAYSPLVDVEKFERYDVVDSGEDLLCQRENLTEMYGYVRADGSWAIQPQYKMAYNFQNGRAVVQMWNTTPHWGAINTENKWNICPRFRSSSNVNSAVKSIEDGRLQGVELWSTENPLTGTYGYLDHFGEWALFPRFKTAYQFDGLGHAVVQEMTGFWGAIDKKGEYVVPATFTNSSDVNWALDHLYN